MKNALFISLTLITLFACSKEDSPTPQNGLEGRWLLTEITGGFIGTGYQAKFDHLQINTDNRYSLLLIDSVLQAGDYELIPEDDKLKIRFFADETNNLFFADMDKTVLLSEQDQKLVLSEPCCDTFVYHFEKESP